METIPQKELRNNVGGVLRRVEGGESFTVTVLGRPVAEIRPLHRRRWVGGPALTDVWRSTAPRTLDADLAQLDVGLTDPFQIQP